LSGYRIDLEEVGEWAKAGGFRRVLIQAPPGLWPEAARISEFLEKNGIEAIIHGGSCWGGCDVAYLEAKSLRLDAIIHMGHSRFLERDEIPTYYLECRYMDPEPLRSLLRKVGDRLDGFRSIGVGLTVQWLDFLDEFLTGLRNLGFEPYVGEPMGVLRYRGQVLGCNYRPLLRLEEVVDCYLVVGSVFHGLGLALQTSKPTYAGDPHTQKIVKLEERVKNLLKSRYGHIQGFKRARRIGVLLSVKPGQRRVKLAMKLKELIEEAGKISEVVVVDDVREDYLLDLPHEAFVNTACPRLSIEDQERLRKPLLLPMEVAVALGRVSWEEIIRTPSYMAMEIPL